MKICHIVRQFYPMIGGMENFVYLLGTHQIMAGHEVTVLTLDRNFMTNEKLAHECVHDGIKIIRIPYLGSKKYPLALSALKYVGPFDFVHIHGVDFFIDYFALTKFIHRKKIILHTHGGYFHTRWGYWIKKVFFHTVSRTSIKFCDQVIAISDNDYSIFKKITNRIVLIANGIDTSRYQLPKKVETGRLISVGRIDVHKRVDNVIKTCIRLQEKGLDTSLRIIGPDWKGMKKDLEKLIPSTMADKISFTGPVDDQTLSEEYSKAHFFMSASEYEGFGLTAIEAMSSGTPTILNDIDSFRAFLKDKDFGKVVKFSDIDSTADSLAKFINMPTEEYNKISNKARLYADNYSWKKIEKKISEVYNKVVSPNNA